MPAQGDADDCLRYCRQVRAPQAGLVSPGGQGRKGMLAPLLCNTKNIFTVQESGHRMRIHMGLLI